MALTPQQAVDLAKKNPNSDWSKQVLAKYGQDTGRGGFGGFAKGVAMSTLETTRNIGAFGQDLIQGGIAAVTPGVSKADIEKSGFGFKVLDQGTPDILKPKSAAEKAGYATGEIGQFFIPESLIVKGIAKADRAIDAVKVLDKTSKLAGLTKGALKLASRSAIEGASAGTITALQGNSPEEANRNALIAAVFPLAAKGISVSLKVAGKTAIKTSGLGKNVAERIRNSPEAYQQAIEHVTKNPDAPYASLAQTIATKLDEAYKTAKTTYEEGVSALQKSGKKFDVSGAVDPIRKAVRSTGVSFLKAKTDDGFKYVIKNTAQNPLNESEQRIIGGLLDAIAKTTKADARTLQLLDTKISNAFNQVETPFAKKVLTQLSKEFDKKAFGAAGASEFSALKAQFKPVQVAYQRYAKKFIEKLGPEADGKIVATGEQFLSNLTGNNKSGAKELIGLLETVTGIPILDNAIILNDAKKILSEGKAGLGRTGFLVNTIRGSLPLGGAYGGSSFGPLGTAAGFIGGVGAAAATSPTVVGKSIASVAKRKAQIAKILADKPYLRGLVDRLTAGNL